MMTQYIQRENCEATELDGEWIILNTGQFTVTKLNDIGGYCWTLLTNVQTVDSLTQSIVDTFPSTKAEEQIRKDIEEFLKNLLECGLIQHVD